MIDAVAGSVAARPDHLSFAGVEVIRVEANPDLDLVDINIKLGEPDVQVPGFMRRLIVLEKS